MREDKGSVYMSMSLSKIKNPFAPVQTVIRNIKEETYDIKTYTMAFMNGPRRFEFKPGQFNMLSIPGVGECAASFSAASNGDGEFKHTIRSVGRVTNILSGMGEGDVVGIRGPYGTTWPMEKLVGKDVILVAGGIGIAPLRPVVRSILDNMDNYRSLNILYGSKTIDDMLYKDEFESWENKGANLLLTLDNGNPVEWPYHKGVVTTLFENLTVTPSESAALICGPDIMMKFSTIELLKQGFSEDQIYLSLERRMDCAVQMCGHCMLGHFFVCKDGPVFSYRELKGVFGRIA